MDACGASGASVTSFENPNLGPSGEKLYTDCVSFGAESAHKVLIVNSAIHGAEGFCGSGAQIGWLRAGRFADIPSGMRVVLIHALNPFGFAWLRRVNEDNVDLNRNFVRFSSALPGNSGYETFHHRLTPARWDDATPGEIGEILSDYADRHGLLSMQAAICSGQYRHRDGIFYGGERASWSSQGFEKIIREHASGASQLLLLDFHTGLGPYGVPELISSSPPDAGIAGWFSDKLTCALMGNAVGPSLNGTIGQGLRRFAELADVHGITAEFGTYDVYRVLLAVIADNWLHARGSPKSGVGKRIKLEIRKSFYPDEDDWRDAVAAGSQRILDEAVAGLASS